MQHAETTVFYMPHASSLCSILYCLLHVDRLGLINKLPVGRESGLGTLGPYRLKQGPQFLALRRVKSTRCRAPCGWRFRWKCSAYNAVVMTVQLKQLWLLLQCFHCRQKDKMTNRRRQSIAPISACIQLAALSVYGAKVVVPQ